MLKWIVGLALLAAIAPQEQKRQFNSYLGKAPPGLKAEKEHWVGPAGPQELDKLKGKAVYLEFGFLECPGCKHMKPHQTRWHEEYADRGLVIIDVDDGTKDTMEAVRQSVDKEKIEFTVLWDKDAKNIGTYGVKLFPTAYVVGVDGKVVWEGNPAEKPEHVEKIIKDELAKVKGEGKP
ncbi:MAG: redoxin domain-containing protein [Planctomycetes bacterium]|nr:redoxin domain-containing protein [Planctomycetota bacterium]